MICLQSTEECFAYKGFDEFLELAPFVDKLEGLGRGVKEVTELGSELISLNTHVKSGNGH